MSRFSGCAQLGRAISSMVDLAVEISFISDSARIVTHSRAFGSLGRFRTYSALLRILRESLVFAEDTDEFESGFCVENVVTPMCDGEHKVECELRMKTGSDGQPIWYNAMFIRINQTGDFDGRAMLIISDINHHKEVEAHAARLSEWVERDPLTGLYNKKAAQTLIDTYLNGEGRNSRHTMIFCDLDDFKGVNDKFGHPMGDALLSAISERLTGTFRREDILCRIGGDEFVILMKNASGRSYVSHRADVLLERMSMPFELGDNRLSVTLSLGIAGYPDCGSTYSELLQNADKAMYVSKNNGKNQYYFFEDLNTVKDSTASDEEAVSDSSSADSRSAYRSKEKIGDYIFNTLYESTDISRTIPLVLQLMGTHFQLGRVTITEFRGDTMHVIHQWNANGIKELDRPIDYTGELRALFEGSRSCENMTMRYDDIDRTPAQVRSKLQDAGIDDVYAFLHCPLLDNGVIRGYIVFFDCNSPRTWSDEERSTLSYVARLISLFVFKQQAYERTAMAYDLVNQAMDGSPLSMVIVDPESYRLRYVTRKLVHDFPNAAVGEICYRSIYGFDAPCDFCPMRLLKEEGTDETRTLELSNHPQGLSVVYSAAGITLEDGQKACLCGRIDTSQYKVRELELEAENARLRQRLEALGEKTE